MLVFIQIHPYIINVNCNVRCSENINISNVFNYTTPAKSMTSVSKVTYTWFFSGTRQNASVTNIKPGLYIVNYCAAVYCLTGSATIFNMNISLAASLLNGTNLMQAYINSKANITFKKYIKQMVIFL